MHGKLRRLTTSLALLLLTLFLIDSLLAQIELRGLVVTVSVASPSRVTIGQTASWKLMATVKDPKFVMDEAKPVTVMWTWEVDGVETNPVSGNPKDKNWTDDPNWNKDPAKRKVKTNVKTTSIGPFRSDADLDATFVSVGFKRVLVRATMSFKTMDGKDLSLVGFGETIVAVGAVGEVIPFAVEGRPNSDVALNDVFVEQPIDPVEVLKDWKTKFTAPAGATDVKWLTKAGMKEFGKDSPLEVTEKTAGRFRVIMTGKLKGKNIEGERLVIVGDVESTEFDIMAVGEYERSKTNPFDIIPPSSPAVTIKGRVALKKGSPELSKFQWGYIQGTEAERSGRWDFSIAAWAPGSDPKGVLTRPDFLALKNVPPNTNDAPATSQLYDLSKSNPLGTAYGVSDTPSNPEGIIREFKDNLGQPVRALYKFATPQVSAYKFKMWQTAFHSETQQYVPVRQKGWLLTLDAREKGPFKATPLGDAASLEKLTDKANPADPFNKLVDGPAGTTKHP